MNKLFLIPILLFLCSSCFHLDKNTKGEKISIQNQTNEIIYICISCNDSLFLEDSINISYISDKNNIYEQNILKPNMIKAFYNDKISNDNKDKQLICKDKKLRLFILLDTTIVNYSWDEIVKKQIYKEKFVFTKMELDSLGYSFVYN